MTNQGTETERSGRKNIEKGESTWLRNILEDKRMRETKSSIRVTHWTSLKPPPSPLPSFSAPDLPPAGWSDFNSGKSPWSPTSPPSQSQGKCLPACAATWEQASVLAHHCLPFLTPAKRVALPAVFSLQLSLWPLSHCHLARTSTSPAPGNPWGLRYSPPTHTPLPIGCFRGSPSFMVVACKWSPEGAENWSVVGSHITEKEPGESDRLLAVHLERVSERMKRFRPCCTRCLCLVCERAQLGPDRLKLCWTRPASLFGGIS